MTTTHGPRLLSAAALAAAGLALASPAMAEMGTSPVGPGGMYLSLFGGYVNSDGPETRGHIPGPLVPPVLVPLPHVKVGAEDGGFVGGTAGFVLGDPPLFALQNMRIEANVSALIFEDDSTSSSGSVLSLDGLGLFGSSLVESRQSREVVDYSVQLKGDIDAGSGLVAVTGLELFIRRSTDETSVRDVSPFAIPSYFRKHDVDALYFGAMAILQPEFAVAPNLSLVADLGAGLYGLNASLDSSTSGFVTQSFSDGASTIGFRGRVLGGIKLRLFDDLAVTAFGGVDYWSDAPFANQSPVRSFVISGPLPNVAFDDLIELKAGLMLTWAFGPAGN